MLSLGVHGLESKLGDMEIAVRRGTLRRRSGILSADLKGVISVTIRYPCMGQKREKLRQRELAP